MRQEMQRYWIYRQYRKTGKVAVEEVSCSDRFALGNMIATYSTFGSDIWSVFREATPAEVDARPRHSQLPPPRK